MLKKELYTEGGISGTFKESKGKERGLKQKKQSRHSFGKCPPLAQFPQTFPTPSLAQHTHIFVYTHH